MLISSSNWNRLKQGLVMQAGGLHSESEVGLACALHSGSEEGAFRSESETGKVLCRFSRCSYGVMKCWIVVKKGRVLG